MTADCTIPSRRKKRALITGIRGQDGALLAKLLIEKGYRVFGTVRRAGKSTLWRLSELGIADKVEIHGLDLDDEVRIRCLIAETRPDEIYNLAAVSSPLAVNTPAAADINGMGPLRLLGAIRASGLPVRFFQASSSEMFGRAVEPFQTEQSPCHPVTLYGASKLFAHNATVIHRERHGVFACSGILFNHESPLRGPEFVTRKITLALARIAAGSREVLQLGNLAAQRDWGFAGDFVKGMWRMLQADEPDDYVLATGKRRSVEEFADLAAQALGLSLLWEGEGASRRAVDRKSGRIVIAVDPKFFRSAEAPALTGCPAKAALHLGWQPALPFEHLVEMMCRRDYERVMSGGVPMEKEESAA